MDTYLYFQIKIGLSEGGEKLVQVKFEVEVSYPKDTYPYLRICHVRKDTQGFHLRHGKAESEQY